MHLYLGVYSVNQEEMISRYHMVHAAEYGFRDLD